MQYATLYMKTICCCMACDGEIAPEEVALIREYATDNALLQGLDHEAEVNKHIDGINQQGMEYLRAYLREVKAAKLPDEAQLNICELAIQMIEADKKIRYSEVAFFKKIRLQLTVTNEQILSRCPGREDFLLPDIIEPEEFSIDGISFEHVTLGEIGKTGE